jgi:beta-glucanase (GH16 family)
MSTMDHSAQPQAGWGVPSRSTLRELTGRRWRRLLLAAGATATIVAGGLTAVTVATPAYAATPTPPAGFTLTWADNFDGAANSGMDTSVWKYDTGPGSSFGTGEIETMTNSTANVFHDGSGHMVLKALHSGTDPNSGWTSGRIETQAATFGAPAGGVVMMEAVIQQPNVTTTNGAGYWPAFWMLGSPLRSGVSWPGSGEVDILEDINGRSSVFGTLHCGTNPGGPCNESSGLGSGEHACPGCQTAYHTYAVQIDRSVSPEQIRWYLDGANYFTLAANRVDATTWSNAVDHPFFIIFDLAMGGGFPAAFGGGPNASTVSGGQLNVDYVAVYNKAPGGGGTTPPPPPGTNIAQGKPTTASSLENATFPASNATDGNTGTRWSSGFSDPQWLRVDLGQTYNISHVTLNWEAAFGRSYQIQTSPDGNTWTTIFSTTTGDGGIDDIALSGSGRYIRMNGTVRATQYGYSLWEFAVNGTPGGGGGGTLLSQGHPTTSSSLENASFPASNATDGNTGTRWSSGFSDPQWLQVDLGATHTVSRVVLNWEAAFGRSYQIQTSNDGNTWTTIFSTTTGDGGIDDVTVSGSGRYVRMNGTVRATQYGYSLWEFQVFGG